MHGQKRTKNIYHTFNLRNSTLLSFPLQITQSFYFFYSLLISPIVLEACLREVSFCEKEMDFVKNIDDKAWSTDFEISMDLIYQV